MPCSCPVSPVTGRSAVFRMPGSLRAHTPAHCKVGRGQDGVNARVTLLPPRWPAAGCAPSAAPIGGESTGALGADQWAGAPRPVGEATAASHWTAIGAGPGRRAAPCWGAGGGAGRAMERGTVRAGMGGGGGEQRAAGGGPLRSAPLRICLRGSGGWRHLRAGTPLPRALRGSGERLRPGSPQGACV